MTRYLLDTNIISNAVKPKPSEALLAWMREQHDADLFIAALTLAEIRRGILEKSKTAAPQALLYQDLDLTLRVLRDLVTSDTERIISYRLLRIARGDQTPLPGFEQDDFVANSQANARSWQELIGEFEAVRRSSLSS